MTGLARPDLNSLLRGVDSFAARAVALGLEHGRLPHDFGDSLLAFLRARSLAFAQYRIQNVRYPRASDEHLELFKLPCCGLGDEALQSDPGEGREVQNQGVPVAVESRNRT